MGIVPRRSVSVLGAGGCDLERPRDVEKLCGRSASELVENSFRGAKGDHPDARSGNIFFKFFGICEAHLSKGCRQVIFARDLSRGGFKNPLRQAASVGHASLVLKLPLGSFEEAQSCCKLPIAPQVSPKSIIGMMTFDGAADVEEWLRAAGVELASLNVCSWRVNA